MKMTDLRTSCCGERSTDWSSPPLPSTPPGSCQENKDMSGTYIIAARRTPIGKLLGSLSTVPAPQLAAAAIRAALADAGLPPAEIDHVILGNVLSAGIGQAPARQAALAAGIPASVGAVTINKV